MARLKIPAVFIRGGTSKGVFFHERDLPVDAAKRDRVILCALGSPDPYRRQLNGMGGGLSSLSKAVTGALLPTGRVSDRIELDGLGHVEVSLVDATNAVVFLDAARLGERAGAIPLERKML